MVYIAEAHPTDEWQVEANERENVLLDQPQDFEERKAAARRMEAALELTIPKLVDSMSDEASNAFSAWPERLYIVDVHGNIGYRGGPGPFEFDPDEARQALERMLGAG